MPGAIFNSKRKKTAQKAVLKETGVMKELKERSPFLFMKRR
jgi:hypothetical protein